MDWLFKLRSLGYVAVGNDIWFANLYFNALIRQDRRTGRIELVDKFPNYRVSDAWLYSAAYYVGGCLVFIPHNSEEIVSYHIEEKKFTSIALDLGRIGKQKNYFWNACVAGQCLYLLPVGAGCMVRYDARERKVSYLQNDLSRMISGMQEPFLCLGQEFEVVDGKVYMPFLESGAVAIFDIQGEQAEVRHMDLLEGCATIKHVDGCFYLSAWQSHKIFRWDIRTDEIKAYEKFPEGLAEGSAFLWSCRQGEEIIFFPLVGNMAVAFSIRTGEIREVQRIQNADREPFGMFLFAEEADGRHVLTADMECVHSVSCQDGVLQYTPCHPVDGLHNRLEISRFLVKHGFFDAILTEGKSPVPYLEVLTLAEDPGDRRRAELGSAGKKIWGRVSAGKG